MITANSQIKPSHLDLQKYSGKWYVISCIPTRFDKDWSHVTESYHVNKKGNIDIFTTYRKEKKATEKSVASKGFPIKESNNLSWKVQFVWPFKADYLVEEINEDYTYVVVGHPKKKFLYIMNRTGMMGNLQHEEIVNRAIQKGYDTSKLRKVDQSL
ncbi:MAG: lipocalin family protein [Bacteroidota bacterium]